jgi:type IV pilus assembly protein PilO
MANLNRVRKSLIAAVVSLGVIDAAAITYLMLPGRIDTASQKQALSDAEQRTRALTREVTPLMGIDGKLKQADKEIAEFYKQRLASRYSEMIEEVGKIASNQRVAIGHVGYKTDPTDVPELDLVQVQANLRGPYTNLAKFVNALERDKMFFIIDDVTLTDSKSGEVRLNIKFETFLRNEGGARSE